MTTSDTTLPSGPLTSYAQNFEDVILWRALGHVKDGRYIDVGAHDPHVDSVSLAFYERGWRGVHVEPNPLFADKLAAARPDETVVRAAVGTGSGTIPFHVFGDTGLSTGDAAIAAKHRDKGLPAERVDVPVVALGSLLDQFRDTDLHWLKIDVEGMEQDALASWGDAAVRPWIVVIESTAPNEPRRTDAEWRHMLLERNYEEVYFDGLNLFFLARERAELRDRFGPGPNVFDRFVLGPASGFAHPLAQSLAKTRAERDGLRAERDGLRMRQGEAEARALEFDERLARSENRSVLRRLLFHRSGRPRGFVRTLFFHASGKPRGALRRHVMYPDGAPRDAFWRWMTSDGYRALRWPAAYYAPYRPIGLRATDPAVMLDRTTRVALQRGCEAYLSAAVARASST